MNPKILKMLNDTKLYPRMYAVSEEAVLMRVSTLLEVAGVSFSCSEFYRKHSQTEGNIPLLKRPDNVDFDTWTRSVVDDGLEMLKGV